MGITRTLRWFLRGVHSSWVSSITRVPVRTIYCVGVNSLKLHEASRPHLWYPLPSCFSLWLWGSLQSLSPPSTGASSSATPPAIQYLSVSLKFICWNPNPQCDGKWGWGYWIIRPWGERPCDGISVLIRRDQRAHFLSLSLYHVINNKEEGSHQEPNPPAIWSWASSLQNCEV